ncbi:UNVERIFIED_CONTAM: hypothetical protein Sradi_0206200 [Sesamum radiatum]|uniref:Reverse transcriptase n=1 Tax=Sesamum radiatum TaxID=300843 RepID=A0AAW2W0A9_SESRA
MRKKKGDLTQNVQLAAAFLAIAQQLHQKYNHNSLIQKLASICRKVYMDAVGQEQAMLKQRAKIHWLKEGDQCSRIFFRRIRQKRIIQRVFQITTPQGDLISDYNGVQEEFVRYYQTLLGGRSHNSDINLQHLVPWVRHRLSTEEANALVVPVQWKEVYEALISISDDKAPRLDGRLLEQINATMLALIPKVYSPSTVANFRPIACCNVLYKIIAKILVKRMQGVMDPLQTVPKTHLCQDARLLITSYWLRNCLQHTIKRTYLLGAQSK